MPRASDLTRPSSAARTSPRASLSVSRVDARHLLIALGHDAHFLGRRSRCDPRPGRRRGCRPAVSCSRSALGRGVAADQADERRPPAERDDVVRDVRRRRRADTCSDSKCTTGTGASGEMRRHAADDEPVEHHVADDEHGQIGESRDEIARARWSSDGSVMGARLQRSACGAIRGGWERGDACRNSIRHFRVAEVVLEESGGQQRREPASAAAARATLRSRSESPDEIAARARRMNHEPDGQRRQSALGGNLHEVVVQVRVDFADGVRAARILPRSASRPCSARRRRAGCAAIMRPPSRSIATRSRTGRIVRRRTSTTKRCVIICRRDGEEDRGHDRRDREAGGSPSARTAARRATQAPTAALRVDVSATATASAGMTSAAHVASPASKQDAGNRDADDQHQQARVRHVSARACRAAAGRGWS